MSIDSSPIIEQPTSQSVIRPLQQEQAESSGSVKEVCIPCSVADLSIDDTPFLSESNDASYWSAQFKGSSDDDDDDSADNTATKQSYNSSIGPLTAAIIDEVLNSQNNPFFTQKTLSSDTNSDGKELQSDAEQQVTCMPAAAASSSKPYPRYNPAAFFQLSPQQPVNRLENNAETTDIFTSVRYTQ